MQVLIFQLRTIVINLVFDVVRGGRTGNGCCNTLLHFSESPIYKPQHCMHMLQLGVGKSIVTILAMAIQGATEVIHRVADTLQFGYLAQHLLYLRFRGIRQSTLTHLVQVGRNLHLHRIGDILVFLNARKSFIEYHFILRLHQICNKTKHSVTAFGKVLNLLLSLHNAEFCCREQTTRNELQTIILVLFLHRQYATHK